MLYHLYNSLPLSVIDFLSFPYVEQTSPVIFSILVALKTASDKGQYKMLKKLRQKISVTYFNRRKVLTSKCAFQ